MLANWISQYQAEHPDHLVVSHFTGCDPGSTHLRNLLLRLVSGLVDDLSSVGVDAVSPPEKLASALTQALEHAAGQLPGVVVVIDAVNQLVNDKFGWLEDGSVHSMKWLPKKLPTNVHVVCSTTQGDCHTRYTLVCSVV